jgi:translation elongation factor EF-G
MFVPEPVISLAIKANGIETPNFSRALQRFQKEDPTFKVHMDKTSKEVCCIDGYYVCCTNFLDDYLGHG